MIDKNKFIEYAEDRIGIGRIARIVLRIVLRIGRGLKVWG